MCSTLEKPWVILLPPRPAMIQLPMRLSLAL
jgi:hypothetical protein